MNSDGEIGDLRTWPRPKESRMAVEIRKRRVKLWDTRKGRC